jgi:hypothetical protein
MQKKQQEKSKESVGEWTEQTDLGTSRWSCVSPTTARYCVNALSRGNLAASFSSVFSISFCFLSCLRRHVHVVRLAASEWRMGVMVV